MAILIKRIQLSKLFILLCTLLTMLPMSLPQPTDHKPAIFREYIGAESKNVKLSDVPINPHVEFHYILAFAMDYTTSKSSPNPTDGKFNIFWDTDNCTPSKVSLVKNQHSNVKVAFSLGGDTAGKGYCYFTPSSVDSWVSNAVSSLTNIIQEYSLDGIDIDYEHFHSDPETFAECTGKLVTILKKNGVISFASIAPFDDDEVQRHYLALWKSYGHMIDYVNFQFYAYDNRTSVGEFLKYFEAQRANYEGGKVLVSFTSEGSGGLSPKNGFFKACNKLKSEGKLDGIFVWCADSSKASGFRYERQSQALLAVPHLHSTHM